VSESKSLVKNTAIYALGGILPRLLSFISFPILTSYLTPADYGIVNYVNTLNTFLMVLGFLSVNTYYLVFFYRCKNHEEQKKLLGNLTSFILLFNLILLALLLIFGVYIYQLLDSEISFYPYIFLGLLIHFFNLFSVLPSALYRLLEKPLILTAVSVSKAVVTLILILVMVVYLNYTAIGVLYATLTVHFVYAFVFLYLSKDHITWNLNLKQIKKVLLFSLPLVPGSLAYYITTLSDRILIDRYLTLNDLGIYSTAATLALILNIFSYGSYKAFEPYIFKNWGKEGFIRTFDKIRNAFVYVLLIGVLGLSVFSKEFFQIMSSPQFHIAYWYVPFIIIGVYSASLSMLYGTIITAQSKTKINSLINTVGAVISITLNVILLPKFGLIVAALVSSFAMSVMLFISIRYANLAVGHIKPFLGMIWIGLAVYFMVYVVSFDDLLLSMAFKASLSLFVIVVLSFILSINPLVRIAGFLKK
jgi:O-antigen/teichoic acid export membrane protein